MRNVILIKHGVQIFSKDSLRNLNFSQWNHGKFMSHILWPDFLLMSTSLVRIQRLILQYFTSPTDPNLVCSRAATTIGWTYIKDKGTNEFFNNRVCVYEINYLSQIIVVVLPWQRHHRRQIQKFSCPVRETGSWHLQYGLWRMSSVDLFLCPTMHCKTNKQNVNG